MTEAEKPKGQKRDRKYGDPIPVRLEPDVLQALKEWAAVEERTPSEYLRILVRRQLKLMGAWSPEKAPGPASLFTSEKKLSKEP